MSFSETIRGQVKDALRKWKPSDVEVFNGSSWMNLISLVIGAGQLDCDAKVEVTAEDRKTAAKLLRKALEAAATNRGGVVGVVKRIRKKLKGEPFDVIAFYKARIPDLPPHVESKPTGYHPLPDGRRIPVAVAQPDPAWLERHEALAALVLERFEADPDWKPTEEEGVAATKLVGIR